MYLITKVIISGFWGNYRIETNFFEDVNIFIGKNGTGKTTFINTLQGALSVNLDLLKSIQFSSIEIYLKKGRSRKTIKVSKEEIDLEYKSVTYKIGKDEYRIPFSALTYDLRSGRIHPRVLNIIEAIKVNINSLYNVSYLSVHRELHEEYSSEITNRRSLNNVDRRLNKLMSELTSLQLRLETEGNELSKTFESEVLQSMLYDESIDTVDLSKFITIDIKGIENGLRQAYTELGVSNPKIQGKITSHANRIEKAAEAVNEFVEKQNGIEINDIMPLSLLRRTEKIINLSRDTEFKRKAIFEPITNYLVLIKSFIKDKNFKISQRGGLRVEKNGKSFQANLLSSGEKQLLILLTESLLQEKREFIYIADEPELSLHIAWQRQILPSIIDLNPKAQIIVATHSPEIAGKHRSKLINMENIITNG